MTGRNWRPWASARRLRTHTTMSTLKAPGDISAPKDISEKAENNRPHSNVFLTLSLDGLPDDPRNSVTSRVQP